MSVPGFGKKIYAGLPEDWRLLIEHKMYEPAFYATVIQDWGSSFMAAQTLVPQAHCLVDLGHHAPNVNIEMIVARLIHAGRLGGFHSMTSSMVMTIWIQVPSIRIACS